MLLFREKSCEFPSFRYLRVCFELQEKCRFILEGPRIVSVVQERRNTNPSTNTESRDQKRTTQKTR